MANTYLIFGVEKAFDPAAWIALGLSSLAILWAIWSELTGYRRRQADEYWYRGIFSPNCVVPLIDFLNAYIDKLQRIDVKQATAKVTRKFCEDFAKEKEAILTRLWISQLFSTDYYELACAQLDGIEDEMATKFGGWVVKPASASVRDVEALRNSAIAKVGLVLASAANLNPNKFVRQQKKLIKQLRAAGDA